MKFFSLLNASGIDVDPKACKIHLAVYNGKENPLDVFFAGEFDDWQEYQQNKNFNRAHVIGLIALAQRGEWLFTGFYDTAGCRQRSNGRFRYKLVGRAETEELAGRLVVRFERTGRQSYLNADNWLEKMRVAQILPVKMAVSEFPGYSAVTLTKQHLDIVVGQDEPSWRGALANVAGVYVIADRSTGKLYVGSATGDGGLWARWSSYSRNGHGGNKELKALLREKGLGHAEHFQFGILEIADGQADGETVLERESYWKRLLLSREFGLNAN